MEIHIRPAQPEHFPRLRDIELAAFETLRAAGGVTGPATANSVDDFSAFSRNGLLLVACTPGGTPAGFVAGECDGPWLHIAEIDVHPDWQQNGISRLLMQAILRAGRQRGMAGATLTTDNIAAFNARFYASLGFTIVDGQARPPHLARLHATEQAQGFDPSRRVTMLMTLPASCE